MLKLALITVGIVGIAVVFMCIKIILIPGGKFGSTHIGGSKAMRERGIHCVQSMDAIERRDNPHRVKERKTSED